MNLMNNSKNINYKLDQKTVLMKRKFSKLRLSQPKSTSYNLNTWVSPISNILIGFSFFKKRKVQYFPEVRPTEI